MLEPGAAIPQLSLTDDTGNRVTSDDLRGRWTVLWWYVKADTPG